MIDIPQLRPTSSWKNLRTALATSIERLQDVRVGNHECASPWWTAGWTGPTSQREALGDGIEATVAEGIAAQQAPGRQERPRG